jgi:hypothetical protein
MVYGCVDVQRFCHPLIVQRKCHPPFNEMLAEREGITKSRAPVRRILERWTGLLKAEPIRITEGISVGMITVSGPSGFAISRNRTRIYCADAGAGRRRYVWFDRAGKQSATVERCECLRRFVLI